MFNRTHAQASPSVSLEKGMARLRPVRPNGPLRDGGHERQPGIGISPSDAERKVASILAAVAFTILFAVCLALHLLSRSPRWENLSLPFTTRSELQASSPAFRDQTITPLPAPRVLTPNANVSISSPQDLSEQYISYLPHSGFHNQRIALENALVISHILNRTLLVPPVLLGDPPLRYRPSINLRVDVATSSKLGLEHCALVPEAAYVPEECEDFRTHIHVPWEWFIDLSRVAHRHNIKMLIRWDLTDAFLKGMHLDASQTYSLDDADAYQFRFFDSLADDKPLGARYKTRVDLPTLAVLARGHRLLQFGTLFGTTRVRLADPGHLALRGDVRRSMVFTNPDLLSVANDVRDSHELGGDWRYAAVHLRLGDGVFAGGETREQNVRAVWWRLVRELGMTDEDALKIESRLQGGKVPLIPPPAQHRDPVATRASHPPPPPLDRPGDCQKIVIHPLLSIPVYIATDKPQTPALSIFRRTFPCVYFLSDFSTHVSRLKKFSVSSSGKSIASASGKGIYHASTFDNILLAPFLPPFLDAIIASKARVVVGTQGSTFSRFVEDVLWRAYHGWEIVQRG